MEDILHELFQNGYDSEITLDKQNLLTISIFNSQSKRVIMEISETDTEDVNDLFIQLIVQLIKDRDLKH